jgi:phosphoserine phosphatase RsbU/P
LMSGQPPQLVFTASGRVLGLMPAGEIPSETLALHGGETFVLFTDGVSEAFDANGELFGEDRLLAHLEAAPAQPARDTTLGVLDAVRRYAAGAKQSDDITVLSVRYDDRA